MAQDYSEYLAVNVLNEQQYVNYRNLSRALKVHSNLAKQYHHFHLFHAALADICRMLYEFHRKQNIKKPGSLHATYLVSGVRRTPTNIASQSQDHGDEDGTMRSSPPLPSSSFQRPEEDIEDAVPIRSIMLVREEHLEEAKARFESISGVHIYSLQVNGVKDLQVLTECNRRVAADYATEDPLKEWKQYGVVQNKDVRRRTRGQPPPPPLAAVKAAPAAKATAAPASKSAAVEKQSEVKPTAKNVTQQKSTVSAPSKAAGAKNQNSSIFKSFAKGSAHAKKQADSQESSAAPSPAVAPEDVPMTGFSDDDEDDADVGLPAELEEVKVPTGESKNERKSKLEAMMDEEDEVMEDAATPISVESQHDEGAIDAVESKEEPKESVVVENGRRRGRRRIMKKKTVKDEDGYLGESRSKAPFSPAPLTSSQSHEKKQPGNLSLKRNPRRRKRKCLPTAAINQQPRKQVVSQAKATSCHSSRRSRPTHLEKLSYSTTIRPNPVHSVQQWYNSVIGFIQSLRNLPFIELWAANCLPPSTKVIVKPLPYLTIFALILLGTFGLKTLPSPIKHGLPRRAVCEMH